MVYTVAFYCIKNIVTPFNPPSPHSFSSKPLLSGFTDESEDKDSIRDNLLKEYRGLEHTVRLNQREVMDDVDAIRTVHKAIDLHNKLANKELNNTMKEIKVFYSSFFEDNTEHEGLRELESYLRNELRSHRAIYLKNKEKHQSLKDQLFPGNPNSSKGEPSNSYATGSESKKDASPNTPGSQFVEQNQSVLPLLSIIFNNDVMIIIYRNLIYIVRLLLPICGILFSLNLLPITIPTLGIFFEFFIQRIVFL